MKGYRKLVAYAGALAALLAGYVVAGRWAFAAPQFPAFAGGVGAVVAAFMAGNYGEHRAGGKGGTP